MSDAAFHRILRGLELGLLVLLALTGVAALLHPAVFTLLPLALLAGIYAARWLPQRPARAGRLLLAFDGDCLICNRTIRWLVALDPPGLLRYVPLQSTLGRQLEGAAGLGERSLQTVLVQVDGRVLERSTGALRVLEALGGRWRLLGWLGLRVPRPLRDAVYDFIATHRYRWFGKHHACELPSPELAERLVDGEKVIRDP